jgi:Na+-driven multidrug efflux pump
VATSPLMPPMVAVDEPDAADEEQQEQESLLQSTDDDGDTPRSAAAKRLAPPTVWSEVRPMIRLGWPMIVSQYLDRSSQQLCVMLIGHIGPEELGSVVLATM